MHTIVRDPRARIKGTTEGLNRVNRALTKLTFQFMLLKRAYTKSEFQQMFSQTDFRAVDIRESLARLEIRLEK
jgi:hypothetical protein